MRVVSPSGEQIPALVYLTAFPPRYSLSLPEPPAAHDASTANDGKATPLTALSWRHDRNETNVVARRRYSQNTNTLTSEAFLTSF